MEKNSLPGPSGSWLRAKPMVALAIASAVVILSLILAWYLQKPTITARIGLLHGLTGPMAMSETPMVEAELLAIDEINRTGGVLGKKVEPVIADTASNSDVAIQRVEQLLAKERVSVVVGCWTSACRKSVRPTIEQHNALLIYPMAFEGLERSPNIIYTGAAPNQQVLPAVNWAFENLGTRFFLIGSDYVWPHAVNAIVRDQIRALGGTVVGESYVPIGSLDARDAVNAIKAAKPDVILSTIVGDSNPPLYQGFRQAGLSPRQSPIISFSIAEPEIQALPSADVNGHYAAWAYFQAIPRNANRAFVERFRQKYGENRVVSDVMETAYFSVLLWARAVEQSGTLNPEEVNQALLGMNLDAPEGIVTIDPATRHTWRSFHIGQIEGNQTIRIIWSADHPIRPIPYPASRSSIEWEHFLAALYNGWNKHWVNRRTIGATEPQE